MWYSHGKIDSSILSTVRYECYYALLLPCYRVLHKIQMLLSSVATVLQTATGQLVEALGCYRVLQGDTVGSLIATSLYIKGDFPTATTTTGSTFLYLPHIFFPDVAVRFDFENRVLETYSAAGERRYRSSEIRQLTIVCQTCHLLRFYESYL